MVRIIRQLGMLIFFFLLLVGCLFLSDGQQVPIDVIGAGGILMYFLFLHFTMRPLRPFPAIPRIIWTAMIAYGIMGLFFSDDTGYSLYSLIRTMDGLLVFYLFYSYSNTVTLGFLPASILWFACVSIILSAAAALIPGFGSHVTGTNLLLPTYGHNHLVDILLFAVPVGLYGTFRGKNRMYPVLLAVLLAAVIASFARGAMVILSLFLMAAILVMGRRFTRMTRFITAGIAIGIMIVCVGLFVIPQSRWSTVFPERLFPKMVKEASGGDVRIEYYRQGIAAIRERPIIGSGAGTFYLQSKRLQNRVNTYSRYAHNALLETVSDRGAVGGILIGLFILWWIIRFVRSWKRKPQHRSYLGLLASMIAIQSLNAMVDFPLSYLVVLLLYSAVAGALLAVGETESPDTVRFPPAIVVVSVVAVALFYAGTLLCSTGLFTGKFSLPSPCYLSEPMAAYAIGRAKKPLSEEDAYAVYLLHRRNPDILEILAEATDPTLGRTYRMNAIRLDPKNIGLYLPLMHDGPGGTRLDNRNMLRLLGEGFLSSDQASRASRIIDSIPSDVPFESVAFAITPGTDVGYYLSKQYYLLGMAVVEENPEWTRGLWELSAELYPPLSYYRAELASLYATSLSNEVGAFEQLRLCMQNPTARDHCLSILTDMKKNGVSVLPEPGQYRDAIRDAH